MFVMTDSSTGRRRLPALESTGAERVCKSHGSSIFHRYADGRWRCKRCVGDSVSRRHRRVKAELVAAGGGCCAVCGYDRTSRNLQFHHVDPAAKSFAMTMARGKSLAAYTAEAAKCVLVCANCHGEIEAGVIQSPPAGATFALGSLVGGSRPCARPDAIPRAGIEPALPA
jgi:hypothetical protein